MIFFPVDNEWSLVSLTKLNKSTAYLLNNTLFLMIIKLVGDVKANLICGEIIEDSLNESNQ